MAMYAAIYLRLRREKNKHSFEALQSVGGMKRKREEDINTNCDGIFLATKNSKPIGEGTFAKVYLYPTKEEDKVIRTEILPSQDRIHQWNESIRMQKNMGEHAPEIFYCFTLDNIDGKSIGIQVMKKMDKTLHKVITSGDTIDKYIPTMIKILNIMLEKKFDHCDWHLNNWMLDSKNKLHLIDYGNAKTESNAASEQHAALGSCYIPTIKYAYDIYTSIIQPTVKDEWLIFCNVYFCRVKTILGLFFPDNQQIVNLLMNRLSSTYASQTKMTFTQRRNVCRLIQKLNKEVKSAVQETTIKMSVIYQQIHNADKKMQKIFLLNKKRKVSS